MTSTRGRRGTGILIRMPSPFPGMDPYLERRWRDVHQKLVIYIGDTLQPTLPADLVTRAEERVYVQSEEYSAPRPIEPDVLVRQEYGYPAGPPASPLPG